MRMSHSLKTIILLFLLREKIIILLESVNNVSLCLHKISARKLAIGRIECPVCIIFLNFSFQGQTVFISDNILARKLFYFVMLRIHFRQYALKHGFPNSVLQCLFLRSVRLLGKYKLTYWPLLIM